MSDVIDFSSGNFVHLGLGAATLPLPTHTGDMEWYAEYEQSHGDDGFEGRLVSMHTFTETWDTWEMHPQGSELVLCVAGSVSLTQEALDGTVSTVTISAGEAVVNPPGSTLKKLMASEVSTSFCAASPASWSSSR